MSETRKKAKMFTDMSYAKLRQLILFCLLTNGLTAWSQTTAFTVENTTSAGGDKIQVDVTVADFTDIIAFSIYLEWDPDIITYDSVSNINENVPNYTSANFNNYANDNRRLVTAWDDDTGGEMGIDLDDDEVLFTIFFTSACSQTDTAFIFYVNDALGGQVNEVATSAGPFAPITNPGSVIFTPPLNISNTTITNISCNGDNNGCVQVSPANGNPPYSYLWSNGGTTAQICNLAAGTYTCTVTDAGNCSMVSAALTVTEPAVLAICQNTLTDPTCLNSNDGCILLEACGGTMPYTYTWSNGSTTGEICSLGAGTYTCTITDAEGCTTSSTYGLSNPANPLTLQNAVVENATCVVGGSIDLTISGSNTPYTFNWSNNASTEDISGLLVGSYACTITDNKGCTLVSPTYTISLTGNDMTSSSEVTDVDCFGESTGAIDLTINGGATPFLFTWNNNASTEDINNIPAGSYSCTVTDANGCTLTVPNITVGGASSAMTINSSNVVDILCNGDMTGSISLEIGGGTSPYNYIWSTGATTSGIGNLSAGIYSCTITDDNDCELNTGNINISEPSSSLSISNAIVGEVSCFAGADGSISFSTNGGTEPYEYLWNNNETNAALTNLSEGEYQCTITDDNGCTFVSELFSITMPSAITIENNSITDANCAGGGSISLVVEGGSNPYTYAWSNGSSSNPLMNAAAGNYICTITDFNGCSFVTSPYTITLLDSDLALSTTSITDVGCFEGSTGSITLTINGSGTPFTYEWNTGATGSTISNLTAGTYTCTVTDVTGCSIIVDELLVTQPELALQVSSLTQTNVSCKGEATGSATIMAGGGTPPYNYLWSTGSTETTISNLAAGVYTCSITDANNCSIMASIVTITEPATAVGFTNLNVTDLSCSGSNNGIISINGTGGQIPYTFLWSNGATTSSISNLAEGVYQCTITDNNGCTSVSNTINVGSPPSINLNSFVITNATCLEGGSISLTATGGANPYTFLWSNGATGATLTDANSGSYTCIITDAMGCTLETQPFQIALDDSDLSLNSFNKMNISCFGQSNGSINLAVSGTGTPFTFAWSNGATTQNISNLNAGSYICTITDNNGCSVISSSISIQQPASALTVDNIISNNLTCANANDGNITLAIEGGTTPYTYNWIAGGSGPTISNLSNGTYICTITDDNGCTVVTTPISITSPNPITVTDAVLVDASCGQGATGSIDISVAGGQGSYSYSWNNGASTQDLNNISSGTYSCIITDNVGCSISTQDYLINNTGSDLAVSTSSITPVNCFGEATGAIALNITGTATPFDLIWNTGATTQNISDLSAGAYSCTVTDANGCSSISSSIIVAQPDMPLTVVNNNITNVSCAGNNDGSITLQAMGGSMPYNYLWNTGANGHTISDLEPGDYVCNVTDANGCNVSSQIITISESDELSVSDVSIVNVICGQGNIGSIDISLSGGNNPFSYLWSNGATTQDISGLPAGNYVCSITDNNGCELVSEVITVDDEGSDLEIIMEMVNAVNCFGDNSGSIMLDASGTATPLSYLWNNGATTPSLSNLTAGTYSCMVTDANGCSISSSNIIVTQPVQSLTLVDSDVSNSSCNGDFSGTIGIIISGGTPPYEYDWSNGASSSEIDMLAVGEYTCTITDANQCSFIVGPLMIEEAEEMSLASLNTNNAACTLGGSIDIEITGGSGPYSYEWNSGMNDQNLFNVPAGTYICTVTDAAGCTFVTDEISIFNDGTDLSWMSTERQTIICHGDDNGMIDISVTGSVTPFSYSWSNGATTEDIDNLPPGLYSCTVTDASGCSITLSNIAITEPESPIAQQNVSQNNPLCADSADGSILLDIIGGVLPYDYLWNNGNTTSTPTNLGSGAFTCTVTDANGCEFISSTITLDAPPAIELGSEVVEHEINGNNSGSVSISAFGGTGPLSYTWSNGESTETIDGLSMGNYTCTVSDENGCTMVFGPYMVDNIVATSNPTGIDFNLFPNPTNRLLYIESDVPIATIRVLDTRGGLQRKYEMDAQQGQIDLQSLSEGVYLLEIGFKNGLKVHEKIVKVE